MQSARLKSDFSIINNIRDFSKIAAGELAMDTMEVDLCTTIEGVLELVTEHAQRKGLEPASLIYLDVPTRLRSDTGCLPQVLTNLINNTIQFTAQGEDIVRATMERETDAHVVMRGD